MSQVTVNASCDSGIWLSFAKEADFERGWQETVSIQFVDSGLVALMALLHILKEMIPNLEIVYQLGGYDVTKELWATYVLGGDYDVAQIP